MRCFVCAMITNHLEILLGLLPQHKYRFSSVYKGFIICLILLSDKEF